MLHFVEEKMERKGLIFWKSIKYSISLAYSYNKLLFILYIIIRFISATIPFVIMYILKYLFDYVSNTENILIEHTFFLIILFSLITALKYILDSAEQLLHNIISLKVGYNYDLIIQNKMNNLPLSFIDSSEGRNIVDEVSYARSVVVNMLSGCT